MESGTIMKNINSKTNEIRVRDFGLDAEVEMYTARGHNLCGQDRYILDQNYDSALSAYINKSNRTFEEMCGLGEI